MRRGQVVGFGAVSVAVLVIGGLVVSHHGTGGRPAGSASPSDAIGEPSPDATTPTTDAPTTDAPSTRPGPSASSTPSAASPPGSGVFFQDLGDVRNWSNYPQRPQKAGIIRDVTSPSYRGGPTIQAQQTYVNQGGGYHSEVIRTGAEQVGEDRYFGQAIYLPADWQFTAQSVTFQQFSPEEVEVPWLLMVIRNAGIHLAGSANITGTVADITNLRGTWIRIVVRLKLAASGGAVEVWVNGVRTLSMTNRTVLPYTDPSIRWSSGIYCNDWRTERPAGPSQLSIFHTRARIAASYQLAEPANW